MAGKDKESGAGKWVARFQYALAAMIFTLVAVMLLPPGVTGMHRISPEMLAKRLEVAPGGLAVVDVRTGGEFATGHIAQALSEPLHELPFRLGDLPDDREREIVLVCMSGHRSRLAGLILRLAGYSNLTNLDGGMLNWTRRGEPSV